MLRILTGFLAGLIICGVAYADPPDILGVRIDERDGTFRFDVTIAHPDTGWDHYADAFQVFAPDGTMLGERVLLHPHVDEQPFTRSLTAVSVPDGLTSVEIRAKDNLGAFSTDNPSVTLPGR